MYFHCQNFKKDRWERQHRRDKSLIHSRCKLQFGENYGNEGEIRAEWIIGSKTFNLGFSVSKSYVSEGTMTFTFAIPPIALYWGFNWPWLENRKWYSKLVKEDKNKIMGYFNVRGEKQSYTKHAEERAFGLRIFDWTIWGDFYSKTMESCSTDPWWMRWNIDLRDLFLGKSKYSKETLEEEDVKIPMPEKKYDAHIKIQEETWKRTRWPFPKKVVRADIEIKEGIPHPGKGTCSHNCGEDALFGGVYCVTSIPDAICEVIKSVTKCRLTYPL